MGDPWRSRTSRLIDKGTYLGLGLLASIVPHPENRRFLQERALDPAPVSFALGLIQGAVGLGLYLAGWLTFMRAGVDGSSMVLLENWFPDLKNTHFMGLGLVNAFGWFLHPLSWVLAYVALTGLGRIVVFAAVSRGMGEPVVWGLLRATGWVRRALARGQRARALGPLRPDRLRHRRHGELTLVTCRERPEWNDAVTIEILGRFYRLQGREERREGPWISITYRLQEVEPAEVIRSLTRYAPMR